MNNQVTIIYYTSNREDPRFENKITEYLEFMANANNIPIISVSQKPIELGKNICVGQMAANDHNLYRQILIGLKAATTPYVLMAEADCVYPPEYFKFIPDKDDIFYRWSNIEIVYTRYNYYFKKTSSECGMMAGREFFIKIIEEMLEGLPEWNQERDVKLKKISLLHKWLTFGEGESAVVSFKTNRGLRQFTRTISGVSDVTEIPYWGNINDLKKEFSL